MKARIAVILFFFYVLAFIFAIWQRSDLWVVLFVFGGLASVSLVMFILRHLENHFEEYLEEDSHRIALYIRQISIPNT